MKAFLSVIKNNCFFVAALLIGAFSYYFYMFSSDSDKLCVNSKCFFIELAVNESQWKQGLMGRSFLPANKGMLFIFDQEKDYAMWMKNMKIPLDIIFMDKNLNIVSIVENFQPCLKNYCPSVSAGKETMYVLEIGAGLAEEEGIVVGQKAELTISSGK